MNYFETDNINSIKPEQLFRLSIDLIYDKLNKTENFVFILHSPGVTSPLQVIKKSTKIEVVYATLKK